MQRIAAAVSVLAVCIAGGAAFLASAPPPPAEAETKAGALTLDAVARSAAESLYDSGEEAKAPGEAEAPLSQVSPGQMAVPGAGGGTASRVTPKPRIPITENSGEPDVADGEPNHLLVCPLSADARGAATTLVDCYVQSFGGYAGPVTLSCTPEAGLACRFEPGLLALVPNGRTSVKLAVEAPNTILPGKYTLRVGGTGAHPGVPGDSGLFGVRLTIPMYDELRPPIPVIPPNFFPHCPDGDWQLPSGHPTTASCMVFSEGGFAGDVALSVAPPGRGLTIQPSVTLPANASGAHQVFFTVDPAQLGPGRHSFTVTGTSGNLTRSAPLSFRL